MKKLDDKEIRSALISRITGYKDCRVYEEVTVPSGKARADIVAVNGHVIAYEIKSDFDSLSRLVTQVPEYDRNFEMNYIVVGRKFSDSVEKIIPKHWGLIVAEKTRINTVRLSFKRKAKLNPNLSFTDFLSLLSSNDVKKIASRDEYLGKEYSKSKIRSLFKQEVINLLDVSISNSMKKVLISQVRTVLKNI
ncbi:sce7726 family protein [Sutcliffiella sp. NC1]|uniref:sce7726 family protein n=1 Tax=Sutcliffiella sp. NC1 TaxID=3004096 RepID=UPI0022DE2362|nr:sce7726 family protein [Sutcliffiella sp. NC1]WBL16463.1 sce7726 family protein [Sutcliffiella sp. NC1]